MSDDALGALAFAMIAVGAIGLAVALGGILAGSIVLICWGVLLGIAVGLASSG